MNKYKYKSPRISYTKSIQKCAQTNSIHSNLNLYIYKLIHINKMKLINLKSLKNINSPLPYIYFFLYILCC